jgi:O-antigen/teichoic acid export membrane protein
MTQIRKNLITNVMCLIANVLVGLLYTPYLVKELGVVTYGVLPIALVVNQYIIILTDSLQSSVTRFYSLAKELQKSIGLLFISYSYNNIACCYCFACYFLSFAAD